MRSSRASAGGTGRGGWWWSILSAVLNRLWIVGLTLGIVVGVGSLAFGGLMARCDDAYPIAMKKLNDCEAATDRLGKPIRHSMLGCAGGSSETKGGTWGNAQWRIPVSGSKGSGSYSYAAELHGGEWQLVRASLEVEGKVLGILPCDSSWEGQTLEAGRNAKPLLQAFGRTGTVSAASGKTSVTAGQSCDVSVTPNVDFGKTSQFNCRVVVRCGPTVLYGWEGAGFIVCETDEGMPTTGKDTWGTASDTDPILELDIPARRVVVGDDNPKSTWSVEIAWKDHNE